MRDFCVTILNQHAAASLRGRSVVSLQIENDPTSQPAVETASQKPFDAGEAPKKCTRRQWG
jgi:hypothetical protein